MNKMKALAVAVVSKDGEFEDSVKLFVGEDASKQAALWFREGIAQTLRLSWSTDAYEATNGLADKIEEAESVEDLTALLREAWEAFSDDTHESKEGWEIRVLTEERTL